MVVEGVEGEEAERGEEVGEGVEGVEGEEGDEGVGEVSGGAGEGCFMFLCLVAVWRFKTVFELAL